MQLPSESRAFPDLAACWQRDYCGMALTGSAVRCGRDPIRHAAKAISMPNHSASVIWAVLVLSQFIYLAVLGSGIFQNEASDSSFLRLMSYSLGSVCLAEVVIVLFVFRRYVVRPIQGGTVDPSTPPGAQRVLSPLLICWVLIEAIAIHGLVLAVLAGSSARYMLPFLAVSLLLMWFTRPWGPSLQPASDPATLARSGRPVG